MRISSRKIAAQTIAGVQIGHRATEKRRDFLCFSMPGESIMAEKFPPSPKNSTPVKTTEERELPPSPAKEETKRSETSQERVRALLQVVPGRPTVQWQGVAKDQKRMAKNQEGEDVGNGELVGENKKTREKNEERGNA